MITFVFRNQITNIDFKDSPYSPNTTLLEFLRMQNNGKGTKEGCNEGDCGACTVVLIENFNNNLRYRAVNACVFLLASIHGKQILTIEDIGTLENLHPIQQIFVEQHASQCGFCTPGFIMSLFAQKADNPNSSKDELIEAMTGNLCRCTGYRPIVDSAFEVEKLKDLKYFETFARIDLLNKINTSDTVEIEKQPFHYFLPFSFEKAVELKIKNPEFTITAGGTDLVLKITKRKEPIYKIIDISSVIDIQGIIEKDNEFIIGAGTKIEDIYQFSKDRIPAMAEMLMYFGAKQIRNRAAIGGNVATASPIGDILPVLYALNAKIEVQGSQNRIINIDDFIVGYRKTVLSENELIKNIIIPKNSKNQIVKSYKISKRVNLDISTVSACFNILVENETIKSARIVYGGMAEKPKRALKTEEFLKGKKVNSNLANEVSKMVFDEFTPISDARSSAESRKIMAKNLIIKFFEENF